MKVPVKIYTEELQHEYKLPRYESLGAAGMDIRANESVHLQPNETKLIKTGIFVAIPTGWEIQIRPRSGMSLKTKLRIANSPGTIDSDYRGEVCVIAENTHNSVELNITAGERIAQMVLKSVPEIVWEQVTTKEELNITDRKGGFGSTGK